MNPPPPQIWPHQKKDSFVMAKKLRESPPDVSSDDETVTGSDNNPPPSHLYASIMVALEKNQEASQAEAPIRTIERVNAMLKPLANKFSNKIWIAPWTIPDDKISDNCLIQLLNCDTEETVDPLLDLAERYLHDFNRFQSWGRRSYMRLHIVYHPSLSESQILAQMALCQIKGDGGQFFQKAHSNAKDPISAGTLTGSVEEMTTSPDFYSTFKQKWQLSHLGLYWNFMRSKNGGSYTTKKSVLHIEIDRTDSDKIDAFRAFFNQNSKSVTDQFWGTPMQWVPTWDYSCSDETNDRVEKHKASQYKLGISLRSCSVYGVNVYNLISASNYKTLHRALMEVESLYTKVVEKVSHSTTSLPQKSRKEFKGRLFYAIIPCSESQKVTFYYSQANREEATSVARALPHFITSYFKLNPASFCSSDLIASTKSGHWDSTKRIYLSEEDAIEKSKLEALESSMIAIKEVFVDSAHQRAFAMEHDSVTSSTSNLTRGDQSAIPLGANSDTSTLSGSTRASKVDAAVAEVQKEHLQTMAMMNKQFQAMAALLSQHGISVPAEINAAPSATLLVELDDEDDEMEDGQEAPHSDTSPHSPVNIDSGDSEEYEEDHGDFEEECDDDTHPVEEDDTDQAETSNSADTSDPITASVNTVLNFEGNANPSDFPPDSPDHSSPPSPPLSNSPHPPEGLSGGATP